MMKNLEDQIVEKYNLDAETTHEFLQHFRLVRIDKHMHIVEKDVFNDNFYLIKAGILRAYIPDADGDKTLWFGYPGQAITDVWCYHYGAVSPISIEAVTQCELLYIAKEDLESLCVGSHGICNMVRKIFIGHAAETEESFTNLFQCEGGMERYLSILKCHPELLQHVPLKKLASYIHLAPQSLSRIRSQLVNKSNEF